MERITDQSHPRSTFLLAFSKLFERASFYGFKTILILYLTDEAMHMPRENALQLFGYFTTGVLIFGVVGAIIGDLVLGNKKAVITGSILQALGAFSLCISSSASLYIGLVLIVFGGGLYSANLFSIFGKVYNGRGKLLDAGFSIYYLILNIGAFIGIVSIGLVGERHGWTFGFITAGIFMVLSGTLAFFSKESQSEKIEVYNSQKRENNIYLVLVFLLMAIFWTIYQIGEFRVHDIDLAFLENDYVAISNTISSRMNFIFILPMGIFWTIFWTYYYRDPFVKLSIGFMIGALAFGILMFIPEFPADSHMVLFIMTLFCFSLAQSIVGPVLIASLVKYSNSKYLAIIGSLMFLPQSFLFYITYFISFEFVDHSFEAIKYCLIGMIVASLAILFLSRSKLRQKTFDLLDTPDN